MHLGHPRSHVAGVVVILLHLLPRASHKLVLAALYHDVAECHTGDLPAPLAKVSPLVKEEFQRMEREFHRELGVPWSGDLTPGDHCRLKCADYLELYVTCIRQPAISAQRVADRGREKVVGFVQRLPRDRDRRRVMKLLHDLAKKDLL